jgi:hypothetical protein
MTDDWRVTVPYDGEGVVGELLEHFRAGEVEHEAAAELGDRVVVSGADDKLFLYAGSEEDARTAERVVRDLLARHELNIDGVTSVERWHPDEESWEDAAKPLPATADERAAEHARLNERERAESEDRGGVPQWEVRITLAGEAEAQAYEASLRDQGMPVMRRGSHIMAGANTEDDAAALAERLRPGAPAGARFEVEGSGQAAWSALHPFAWFGGLGN